MRYKARGSRPSSSECTALALLVLLAPGARADAPMTERESLDGTIGYFMTGVPLAIDGADLDTTRVDQSSQPASVDVTLTDVPAGATLLRAYLYWGGTQAEGGAPDSTVTLTHPSAGPSVLVADACFTSDGGSATYDMTLCRAEITASMLGGGGVMTGTYTVDDYTGLFGNNSADNASAVVLLVFSEPALPHRRVMLYDGLITLQSSTETISLSGFSVGATNADLTYWALEGDVGGSGTEQISVEGQPGGSPLPLSDGLNPSSNPMNATINTTVPTQTDTLGVDVDAFDAGAALAIGDNSIDVIYSAGTDKWWLGVNVLAVDTNAPPVPALSPTAALLLVAALALAGASASRRKAQVP